MANETERPPPPVQPPPPQAFTPPPKTSYNSARQQELDTIRRKGLAKIFNKHFTTVASKIQHERQAAELALAELERRKQELASNPKSFSQNGGMTMTQLEKMHMELRRRKSEVFRKERETQELYRRYVSQYGNGVADGKHNSPMNTSGTSGNGKSGMPVLHEHSLDDIVWQSDLMHAKATDKHEATKDFDVGKVTDNFNDAVDANGENFLMMPPSSQSKPLLVNTQKGTSSVAGQISHNNINDSTSNRSSNNGANSSDNSGDNGGGSNGDNNGANGTARTPDSAKMTSTAPSNKQNNARKHLRSYDSPTPTSTTSLASSSSEVPLQLKENTSPPEKAPSVCMSHLAEKSVYSDILGGVMVTTKSSNNLSDCDDSESTMSGLTTLDGATVVEAEWRLTEFLRIETDNIRKMFAAEEEVMDGDSFSNDLISDNSHPSIIVGEVSQAANDAEEMARKMEEATAWMKDPTLLESDSDEEEVDEEGGNANSNDVVLEWSCFWSEEHEREYYYNTTTGQTCWTKPQEVEIDFSPAKKSKGDEKEEGEFSQNEQESVLSTTLEADGDSVTVKDYTKTRRVLVESQALNPTEFTNEEMIDVFRPDNDNRSVGSKGSTKQASKVLQYRRKRAKMRKMKRRLRAAFVLLTIVSIAIFVYRKHWLLFLQGKTSIHENDASNQAESSEQTNIVEAEEAIVEAQDKSAGVEKGQEKGEEENSQIQTESEERKLKEEEEIKIEAQPEEEERKRQEKKIKIEAQRRERELKQQEEERIKIEAQRKEQERLKEKKRKEEEALRLKQEEEKERVNVEKRKEKEALRLQKEEEEEAQESARTEFETKMNQTEAGELKEGNRLEEEKTKVETQQSKEKEVKQKGTSKRREKQQKDKKNRTKSEQKKMIQKDNRRPTLCGVPLAYIPSKKCRQLATSHPIYDCQGLTDSMME